MLVSLKAFLQSLLRSNQSMTWLTSHISLLMKFVGDEGIMGLALKPRRGGGALKGRGVRPRPSNPDAV